jgi:thioredoxin-related protein
MTKPSIVHVLPLMLHAVTFSPLHRRDWLRLALAAGLPMTASAQSAGAATLPAAQSLRDELAVALRKKQPLVVMASLEGCPFCRMARQSYLSPMHKSGVEIVQVDMNSTQPVLDFAGQATTHGQLIRQWKIAVTPTVLFFGPGGKEVAERLEGAMLPDFYGAYLDDRLEKGRRAL